MGKYVVGFTGTRDGMTPEQKVLFNEWLVKIMLCERITQGPKMNLEFHHGCCLGADEEAAMIVHSVLDKGWTIIGHPPTNPTLISQEALRVSRFVWDQKQYLKRNCDIVDVCDILLAVPKEADEILRSGTWQTIRYAQTKAKPIVQFLPEGNYVIR